MTTATEQPGERWLRDWGLEVGVAVAVVAVALVGAVQRSSFLTPSELLVAVSLAGAVATSRRRPSAALALVWLAFVVQLYSGMGPRSWELAVALVAFGCARWGSVGTVVASAVSGLVAALVVLLFALRSSLGTGIQDSGILRVLLELRDGTSVLVPALLAMATLVPWLVGLALRFADRARTSEVSQQVAETQASEAVRERQQAQEIARLREGQAQLARDVHDVVGHSLAVILAQAESGQYLADDPAELKQTLATIATSARDSLRDVRQVLTDTQAPGAPADTDLDALVQGVRSRGYDVASSEVGTRQPLPPELATVAYRVLQEMLTNAMRHGGRSSTITVERHWEGELRIEVQNEVSPGPDGVGDETAPITVPISGQPTPEPATTGQGLVGMRRRLEAVGGRLDVRRRATSFSCTAWIPVRSGVPR